MNEGSHSTARTASPKRSTCPELQPITNIDWMKQGEISVRDEGTLNVLLVAPHGYPGNDDNTEILAALLADQLDCFAVVNNRKYDRYASKDHTPNAGDLNDPNQLDTCPDFREPLIDRLRHIILNYTKPPVVLFLHGMRDDYAGGDLKKEDVFAVGAGYAGKYDSDRAFASQELVNTLVALLTEKIGTAKDGIAKYSGENKVPGILRRKYTNGYAVEAIQLEIRCEGFRDSRENLAALAEKLKNVLTHEKMKEFVSVELRVQPLDAGIFDEKASGMGERQRADAVVLERRFRPDEIEVDAEFKKLVHELSQAERDLLEKSIQSDGCLEPLSVWEQDGKFILLDGHHRLEICRKLDRDFLVARIAVVDRVEAALWMINKQVGRRNSNTFQKIELLAPLHELVEKEAKERQKQGFQERGKDKEESSEKPLRTADVMAEKAGVGSTTYRYARDIIEYGDDDLRERLRRGEISIDAARQEIKKPQKRKTAKQQKPKKSEESMGAPGTAMEEKGLEEWKPPPLSDVIVISAGWRDALGGTDALAQIPVPAAAKQDCIVWVWTPAQGIPSVLDTVKAWGFTYRTLFVWKRESVSSRDFLDEVGEYFVVATTGTPKTSPKANLQTVLETSAATGTSREPVGFFTLISQKCPGESKLEMFGERSREGWNSWEIIETKEKGESPERSGEQAKKTAKKKKKKAKKDGSSPSADGTR